MRDLKEMNKTLEWEIPIIRKRGGYGVTPDASMLNISLRQKSPEKGIKWDNIYLKFNQSVLEKHFPEKHKDPYKVAFSFDKDKLIMVFNPPEGIPFFKLSKAAKARLIYNTDLVLKIYDHLGLDKQVQKYYLKIHHFAQLNGMELKMLTPYDYSNKQPLWQREIEGELFK